ncbi:MAG TPA: hypothetical protein EYP46_03060 [Hadesarchaea archaeon]|nr:hypothetical protein [Hadesarchaea archaeon]
MVRTKRALNLRVKNTDQMLTLMKKLVTFDLELEAESKPGLVKVAAHGEDEEIKHLESKMKELVSKC